MKALIQKWICILVLCCGGTSYACSIVYYIDAETGIIYAINNEDYFYDTDAYIQFEKAKGDKLARMWYGWKDFAQGGINSAGLFFDVAVTPDQKMPEGYGWTKGNIGDNLLANASTVDEALAWMEEEKFAVNQSHFLIGDATGNAVIVEWIDGKKHIIKMEENYLIATNFLLNAPDEGNFPCPRYASIEERVKELDDNGGPKGFPGISNLTGGAMQTPRKLADGKTMGTLYSSFFDITNMKMVFLPKLDNSKVIQMDLNAEFAKNKKRRINLFE